MQIKEVHQIYFSATGKTKKVMERMCRDMKLSYTESDITDYKQFHIEIPGNHLAVFGVPSFGGRVPEPAAERLKGIRGNQTPALIFVTYGNRDYDDTLLELKELVIAQGFIPVGAAALVAEHSIVPEIATGRPTEEEYAQIAAYGLAAVERLKGIETAAEIGNIIVKGNSEYRSYTRVPVKPKGGKHCNGCKRCVSACPVGAIPETQPWGNRSKVCISCMRCVAICPQKARKVNPLVMKVAAMSLKKKCLEYRRNEFFGGWF